ncbi:hypothetical protein [Nitratireductor aquibiodomus]|uniref:hypothetical protein n=1 Tax=Nitratireductor aquibiodomus TaxID=204799 RepID=UPI00351F089F
MPVADGQSTILIGEFGEMRRHEQFARHFSHRIEHGFGRNAAPPQHRQHFAAAAFVDMGIGVAAQTCPASIMETSISHNAAKRSSTSILAAMT